MKEVYQMAGAIALVIATITVGILLYQFFEYRFVEKMYLQGLCHEYSTWKPCGSQF